VALLVLVPGCSLLRAPVKAIAPGPKPPKVDPAETESIVQRLADEYTLRTVQAIDEYARIQGTPEVAREVLRWKVVVLSYVMRIAGGPNPYANLVDMVGLVSLNRSALETYWIHTPRGPALMPWLETSRVLESNAWSAASTVFSPSQMKELRQAIEEYHREHATIEQPLFAQPLAFSSSLKPSSAKSEGQTSLLGFVGLDPTAGLDPAVREVTLTRLFAERAMYTLQRMPTLVRWQAEILVDNTLHEPELQQTLTNTTRLTESADRISRAAESFSQTAAILPDRVAEERKAILAALEDQQGKLANLAVELNRTLVSGEKVSASLNTTLTTFDTVMKRFGVGETKPGSAVANTNSPPFNILDYSHTAEQLAIAARELDGLVKDLGATMDSPGWDARVRDLAQVSRQTSRDAKSVLNHAFLLGAGLVLLIFACAIVYRRTARRRPPADRESSA
jgi:hypothetical protein